MRWVGHETHIGEMRNEYKILFRKPRCRWESVDRLHLAQDGDQWQVLVNTVMKFQIP